MLIIVEECSVHGSRVCGQRLKIACLTFWSRYTCDMGFYIWVKKKKKNTNNNKKVYVWN
jgi:hypothetical protein